MLGIFSTLEMIKEFFFLVGYVTSNNIFPEPLTPEEEEKYITRYLTGDEEAKKILIERNLRLVAHIAKKYTNTNIEQEDIISIGTIGLIKAINSYQDSKGVKLRNLCRTMHRKWDIRLLENTEQRQIFSNRVQSKIHQIIPKKIRNSNLTCDDCVDFATTIKYYRQQHGLTQEELGKLCNVSEGIIRHAEQNEHVTVTNLLKMKEVMKINEKQIINDYDRFLMDNPNQKIKKYMKDNKITLKNLREKTGISKSTCYHWFQRDKCISRGSYEKLKNCGLFNTIIN